MPILLMTLLPGLRAHGACWLTAALLVAPAVSALASPQTPVLGYSPANMDKRVSPRQDFTGYAAGNWLRHTEIPASEAEVGGFTQLAANLDRQLLTLIKNAASAPGAPGSPQQQIGDYWRAAMDLQRMDQLGLKPLQADLNRIDTLPQPPAALGQLSARLELGYGVSPLLNAFPTIDAKDSKSYLLMLVAGQQSLSQEEYAKPENQSVRELYLGHISAMLKAAGESDAEDKARTVLAIETEISAAQLTPIQARDPAMTYNKMSLAEAQALIPAIDLGAKLQALGLQQPALVQVRDLAAIKAVQQVLSSRPAHELRSLLRWHVLTGRASSLGQPWRGLAQEFDRKRQGLQTLPERERQITQAINSQLFHPLSRLYVEAYFPASTRSEITQMVAHIKDEFEQRLRTNPWLDAPTRSAALDKLAKVDIQVGYPQQWIDFSGLQILPDDHFGNTQRADEFSLRRQLARLGQPVINERFADPPYTTPTSVNAAYNPQTNSIDITAAIVQPPFYVPGADAAVNYCTIGAVIGHELTHGFDSNGRRYGPAGNLRDWWTPQASAEFEKRTALLVQQFGEFILLPGLKHNGVLTLTENTADLGGITLAHAALHRHLRGKAQPRVDGLSTDQRCFVAWAQMWAYKARPERIRQLAAIDYHANSSLRGFAPLLHLDAFHKAIGTRPGDPMWRAPKERARIW
ncbi:M13 family metallopeptidase [Paucibacter sp. O1-1]|nr:M13 family metallopeptidase [Paucibacter sp. O1-1]MDA3829034.1 M13 family metallopeptidase [Paucibacter sp. O1-1]